MLPIKAERQTAAHSAADARSQDQPSRGILWRASCIPDGVSAGLAGLAAFIVYFRTLAPSIVWGDSPELTTAAFCAGVPHPTGYPLYMLLAHAFLRCCPFGTVAYRMNLLAALSAALAVALIYLLMRRIVRDRASSLAAALIFAFSQTFWSQAIIAEHYTFEVLLIAAVLSCLLTWARRGERRWLRAAAVIYGLCLTHHMMSLLLAPGLLFYSLTSRHRAQFLRELRWTLLLFLLPLSLYLYLPLAALRDPPADWGDPRIWSLFVAHVTGREYHYLMFHLTWAQLWNNVRAYSGLGANGSAGFLLRQFSPVLLALAPVGVWSLARHQRRLLGLTLLVYLVDVIYALNYSIYNVEIYYLPSHLMVALWIGAGLRQGGAWARLWWRRLAMPPAPRRPLSAVRSAALLIFPLALLAANWRVNNRGDDWSALVYGRAALATLKPNALVLAGDDNDDFPLLYARYVERRRPDVILLEIEDVLTPGRLRLITRRRTAGLRVVVPPGFSSSHTKGLSDDTRLLKRLIADNMARHPIYVFSQPELLHRKWLAEVIAPYCQVADSNVSRIELTRRPPPLAVPRPRPQRGQRIRFCAQRPGGGAELELLGYDINSWHSGGVPLLQTTYYWRVNEPPVRPTTVWVLFTDAMGNYQRKEDGSPEFQNIHPLAYGLWQRSAKLPWTLGETFTLYVPPGEWDKPLHMRLAVAQGGKFLSSATDSNPWVDMGELCVAGAGDRLPRIASAGPLGGGD